MTRTQKRLAIGGGIGAVAIALGYEILHWRSHEHEKHTEHRGHEHKEHNERGEYGKKHKHHHHHEGHEHGD
jgi:hypothetical protein